MALIFPLLVIMSIYWPGDGVVGKHNYAVANPHERYDAHRMACASKTLPLGSHLYLSHGRNHAEVVIDDRGPYVKGRSLDCTPAVNEALHTDGLARVSMQWPPLPKERPQ